MATTLKIYDIVQSARAMPDLTPVFGQTSGFTQEPALTFANMVMQRFLAQRLDWKFNRAAAAPFLTVALQQDYITSITNLGWITQSWRIDINNTANPKPVYAMEEVRDLAQTYYQAIPFNISWVPNSLAIYGTWQRQTQYLSGLGAAQTPASPTQQFIDTNGNFLYVTGFGTSGNSQPAAPANSVAGVTVTDGGVTWTVADPNGIAFRMAPLPASSGIVWEIHPIYQKKPPRLTSLQNLISPIPDEFSYLFQQGFNAYCYKQAGPAYAKRFEQEFQQWLLDLDTALRSGDRESEDAVFYPSESLTGGGPLRYGLPIGAGWPFQPYGY
jgi:hypothetical protein